MEYLIEREPQEKEIRELVTIKEIEYLLKTDEEKIIELRARIKEL